MSLIYYLRCCEQRLILTMPSMYNIKDIIHRVKGHNMYLQYKAGTLLCTMAKDITITMRRTSYSQREEHKYS